MPSPKGWANSTRASESRGTPRRCRTWGAQTCKRCSPADMVIAATDDPSAQQIINACSFHMDRPALFIGMYRGAKGGEVVLAVPGLTPCFRCQTGKAGAALDMQDVDREVDYGTGRLSGEIALRCDIQHVSSAAIRLCLSLLAALKQCETPFAKFTVDAVKENLHLLTMGMEPDYWFYPHIFENTSGQYAFQTVWLTGSSSSDCSICGSAQHRQDDPFSNISPSGMTTSEDSPDLECNSLIPGPISELRVNEMMWSYH